MRKSLLVCLCSALALGLAWLAGGDGKGDLSKPSVGYSKNAPVPMPEKAVDAAASAAASGPSNSSLSRLLNGEKVRLTAEQLQSYLRENNRNAESLLTASRLSSDLELLREARRRFPHDPQVHLEIAMKAPTAVERQQAMTALSSEDLGNAMGPYLAARAAFVSGDRNAAAQNLREAAQRPALNDYGVGILQATEEAYLAAGYSPLEAKAAAVSQQEVAEAEELKELSQDITSLMNSYAEAGAANAAQSMAEVGRTLGQRIQNFMGRTVAAELIGSEVESRFLKGLNPATVIDEFGQTAQQRLEQLNARKSYIKNTMRGIDPASAGLNPQLMTQYLDRAKVAGELQALQWLRMRVEVPSR